MKLEITQEQAQQVLTIVAEYPAKQVMPAIDILRNLQPIEENNGQETE